MLWKKNINLNEMVTCNYGLGRDSNILYGTKKLSLQLPQNWNEIGYFYLFAILPYDLATRG